MRKCTILIFVLFIAFQVLAQNEIHLLKSDSTLTFKKIKMLQGSIKCIPFEKEKSAIIFSNNKVEYMNWGGKHWGPSDKEFFKVKDDLFQNETSRKGALDACRNYSNYHGAATGTFCTTFFAGAILGLIPAISTSSTTPKPSNLNIPDTKFKDDQTYITSYKRQAKNMKAKRVWTNYALGIELAILVGVALNMITVMTVAK